MNTAVVKGFGMGVLLIALSGLQAAGCSSELDGSGRDGSSAEWRSGSVSLNLVPVSGITITSVNYVVTGTPTIPGTPLPSGMLPTPGTSNNFTFGIPVPVGTGYTLSLTAVSAETGDDITCTGSHGPFDVAPNTSTGFQVALSCADNSNGQLVASVDVKTNACPRLIPDYVSAIPGEVDISGNIALNALGHDLDGQVVSYAWSIQAADADVGTFTHATSAAASFLCNRPGSSVPVTVTMKNGECTKDLKTFLTCFEGECGNGVLDLGEDCDWRIAAQFPGGSPAGTDFGCPRNCHASCGNGIIEAPTEQCDLNDGPPTGTCDAQCRNRVARCGDGFINGTEACDTNDAGADILPAGAPLGVTCAADCSSLRVIDCGDGFVEGTEECDPPNTANCAYNCRLVASTACTACEATSGCAPFALACLNSVGTPTGADQARCFDVEECIQRTNCADGTNTLTSCFCGALTVGACGAAPDTGAGAPAGVCHDQIKAGMGLTAVPPGTGPATNSEILDRLTTRAFASGAGINRFNCLKNDPVCGPLCGF